jgi:uncharacterized protein (DUF2147 family)
MSIARLTTTFALGLLAAQLASGAAVACDNPGKTHELEFKVKGDECVEKVKKKDGSDAETINVCEKDVVQWKVSGNAKSIVFDGASPFEWTDSGSKDKKIEGTVRQGTAGKEFKYSVKVDGLDCVHDPMIIVQP